MDENHTRTVAAVLNQDWDARDTIPGAFDVLTENGRRTFICSCPCGCGMQLGLPIYLAHEQQPERTAWLWNGSLDSPSLTPSIRRLDHCRWHGFLTSGEWQPCGDSGR